MPAKDAILVIDSTENLCNTSERDEVAAAFAGKVKTIEDGESHLAAALAAIDTCITRRAKLGTLADALTASP